MSYGWLTESTLIPKPGKPIKNVPPSSLSGLRSLMIEKEEESKMRRVQTSSTRTKPTQKYLPRMKRKFLERNEGIESRSIKDEKSSVNQSYDDIKKKLELKSKAYDAIASGDIEGAMASIMENSTIRNPQAHINIDMKAKQSQVSPGSQSSHGADYEPAFLRSTGAEDELKSMKERLQLMKKLRVKSPSDEAIKANQIGVDKGN